MPSKHGLDPITTLGIRLRQPVATGEAFEPWAFAVKGPRKSDYQGLEGIACVVKALEDEGYEGEELQVAFADMSRGRWAPTAATLEVMSETA